MKDYFNDYGDQPPTVERVGRPSMWPLPMLIISLIAVVMYWPFLYESVEKRITSGVQTETERAERKSTQVPANADGSSSFDNMLETALRYDREGNRELAATLFQQLLRQEVKNTAYTERAAALLPRAADFYSRGNEISSAKIEMLYRDAYDAIKKIHGLDNYDLQNVHRGLERHYLSLGRYQKAAAQTRLLLEFYRRYYKNDEDLRYNLIQPTTIRLGHNLLAAGRNADARDAYQAALEISKARGRSTSAIEEFIKKTYEVRSATPASMMEQPRTPSNIVAKGSSVTSKAVPSAAGIDLKSAVESISMDGIYIEQLQEADDGLTIVGYADDNKTIANYLRQLQRKIGNPLLNMTKREELKGKMVSKFSIRLRK